MAEEIVQDRAPDLNSQREIDERFESSLHPRTGPIGSWFVLQHGALGACPRTAHPLKRSKVHGVSEPAQLHAPPQRATAAADDRGGMRGMLEAEAGEGGDAHAG